MKIISSNVQMASSSESVSISKSNESLVEWDNRSPNNRSANSDDSHLKLHDEKDVYDKSSDTEKKDEKAFNNFINNIKLRLFKDLIQQITGRTIEVVGSEDYPEVSESDIESLKDNLASLNGDAPALEGWGYHYQYNEVNYESETMNFSASGDVYTEDGRKINFELALNMSREAYSEYSYEVKAGDALIDPLVFNFNGKGTTQSNETFDFDLTSDGNLEKIHKLEAGSGYLVLDKDGNGKIDNGKELFGPETNSGFSELAEYDSNGDGWIDENDPVFYELKIWENSSSTDTSTMSSLKEKNIGAIYLGKADTQFSLYGDNGNKYGQIRESGFFLKESGDVGIIHELDVVV